jgi:hypothetical protein
MTKKEEDEKLEGDKEFDSLAKESNSLILKYG